VLPIAATNGAGDTPVEHVLLMTNQTERMHCERNAAVLFTALLAVLFT
jgi:hypothetical protein